MKLTAITILPEDCAEWNEFTDQIAKDDKKLKGKIKLVHIDKDGKKLRFDHDAPVVTRVTPENASLLRSGLFSLKWGKNGPT